MPLNSKRALKVFLCHASGDKPYVRDLYKRLLREGIDAWLDQEKLLPGQDWRVEIPRAVRAADVVVICLSNKSVTKEGYIQKEIKFALDVADEKPDGTIFLIPARIEDCPVPEKLNRWQWVDLFEENGYTRLLLSLKLNAEEIGADKPVSYEDSDDELEQKLEQLYTEGLAAYYTEEWNKACQRFQAILSERPNHLNALEKMEEAELQRDLSKLYKQATDATQTKDWLTAIKAWEELLKKSPEYRDAAQLFRKAKQQKQLSDLYIEAKKLYAAKKWQAVVKVFDQILALDPNHPDPDNLLSTAQQEVAEIKRLADLNNIYSQAVREIDTKRWQEARKLLEQVHKSQTGFLETELLLRKVEDELRKVEEGNQLNNQINTLYEEAHGLVRTKIWRKALDKIEEIQKLNSHFEDKDGIVEKIHAALTQEEQQAQRQNQLAVLYAEAARLLKEKKYQEALDKWQEVKAIDSKYPDRQRIKRTAENYLLAIAKSENKKPPIAMSTYFWMGLTSILAIAVVMIVILEYKDMVTIPKYKVTALGETCPSYDVNTNQEGFISRSSDPLAPWTGIAVNFQGVDNCPNREKLGEASLIYRYRIDFEKVTNLKSITVSGAAFNGPDSILRVLDENKKVLKTVSTSGGNTSQTYVITLEGVKGKLFYIDEFDTSTTWRFRWDINVNEPVP